MKNPLLIFVVLICLSYNSFSQSPQSFKYQTVVRDNSGNILQNQNIAFRISIQQSTAFTDVYVETHAVTTNNFGLANLEIGTGTIVSGDFASIDWGSDISYLQVEIDTSGGTGFQIMGVSQLLSVPYALYSEKSGNGSLWQQGSNGIYYDTGNVGVGTIMPNGKLQVSSDTIAGINDVIFSVLNAHGDTVFAVYQEGVRIWVSDDTTGVKANGNRGGFAVGGYNPTKATTDEYLRVTPDSVRVYIKETTTAPVSGSRGGFAVGGLNPTKTQTDYYFNIEHNNFPELVNSKARMLWYPFREAFRAGRVLITSVDSVGINSFATGFESKAIGNYSQSFGFSARAFGNNSTAIGFQAEARGANSFAIGDSALAIGLNSLAFGSSLRDFVYYDDIAEAFDTLNTSGPIAYGNNSLAIGYGTVAIGGASVAIGAQDTTFKPFSIAIGRECKSHSMFASVFGGMQNESAGWYSFIGGGQQNTTTGEISSVVGGFYNRSNGYGSAILGGTQNTAYGQSSCIAGGDFNIVNGTWSFTGGGQFNNVVADNSGIICGNFDSISGYNSTIINGQYNIASGNFTTVIGGKYNEAHDFSETVVGSYATVGTGSMITWVGTDRLFVIGNGISPISKNNALTVLKNGNIGIGTETPTFLLEVNGTAAKPGGGTWTNSSDKRLKDIHGQYMKGLNEITQLKPIIFNYKVDNPRGLPSDIEYVGFIAQDVKKVFPSAVSKGNDGYLDFNMHPILVAMVSAIKEQNILICNLKNKNKIFNYEISNLKAENQKNTEEIKLLNSKISKIENMLNSSATK